MRTLQSQASKVQTETAAALGLVGQLTTIATTLPRQYVAELIVVRLFSLFEAIVEDAACRMIVVLSTVTGRHLIYCDRGQQEGLTERATR